MESYNTGKEFVTSTITVEEYAIVPYREKNKKLLDDFDRLLEDTGTDILDITKPIAKRQLKFVHVIVSLRQWMRCSSQLQ